MMKSRSNIIVALILIGLASSLAFGQGGAQSGPGQQTTKGAVIKGKAPVNKEVLKVKLPRAEEATLKNGLQVILLPAHKVPTFNMQLVVLSGGLADKPDYRGLASFTASLLREGTKTRSSKDIAEQVDALGATLTANSGLSTMTSVINASGLVENLDQTLDLFADVIRNPTFPQAEVDKYKTRTLAQLQFQRSIPQFLAAEQFQRAIYGTNHPASLIAPPAESLKKLTSKDLADFHAMYYRPNNAILAIVGDVTMKEIMPKLEKVFGDWEKGDVPAVTIPQAPAQAESRIYLIDRPGSVQTVLQLGTLGIERTSPDYFAVLLADRVLGGGPSGRLFMNLREDKGYTYGAYSNFGGSKFRGTWMSSSEVRTDVTEGAMKEFMYELKRLRDEPVSADELENAKRAIIGSFALSLEQPNTLLQNIITQKLYNLPADYWDTYPQKVSAITVADVQNAAKKYIDLGHLQVVAVGDAAKARDILAKYGKVEVYDAEGKLVPPGGSENNK
jgi:predicted Zn-dependent peptidase